ncbi:unnamed protein product [Orchesella dallaii]|uniref:Uncharacterized protein n=1 Tax=Orchesella dallaii TaxID=48710 RepID=A0ABP1PZH9_9HEXA
MDLSVLFILEGCAVGNNYTLSPKSAEVDSTKRNLDNLCHQIQRFLLDNVLLLVNLHNQTHRKIQETHTNPKAENKDGLGC